MGGGWVALYIKKIFMYNITGYTVKNNPYKFTPIYTPIFTPIFTALYTAIYTPIYTPIYTAIYTPIYTPIFTPIYTPIYTAMMKIYSFFSPLIKIQS